MTQKTNGEGQPQSVWQDYVAGTDPTNMTSKLTATIKIGADGKPIVSWKPSLNGETGKGAGIREGLRSYTLYGKQTQCLAVIATVCVGEGTDATNAVATAWTITNALVFGQRSGWRNTKTVVTCRGYLQTATFRLAGNHNA